MTQVIFTIFNLPTTKNYNSNKTMLRASVRICEQVEALINFYKQMFLDEMTWREMSFGKYYKEKCYEKSRL